MTESAPFTQIKGLSTAVASLVASTAPSVAAVQSRFLRLEAIRLNNSFADEGHHARCFGASRQRSGDLVIEVLVDTEEPRGGSTSGLL
jgi:hypothetical protein